VWLCIYHERFVGQPIGLTFLLSCISVVFFE
jgi:hypothetical protein